jgi:hypothetical protein
MVKIFKSQLIRIITSEIESEFENEFNESSKSDDTNFWDLPEEQQLVEEKEEEKGKNHYQQELAQQDQLELNPKNDSKTTEKAIVRVSQIINKQTPKKRNYKPRKKVNVYGKRKNKKYIQKKLPETAKIVEPFGTEFEQNEPLINVPINANENEIEVAASLKEPEVTANIPTISTTIVTIPVSSQTAEENEEDITKVEAQLLPDSKQIDNDPLQKALRSLYDQCNRRVAMLENQLYEEEKRLIIEIRASHKLKIDNEKLKLSTQLQRACARMFENNSTSQ